MGIFLVELLIFFCIRNKRDKGNVLINWQPQNEYFRDFNTNDLRPTMQIEVQREIKELNEKQEQRLSYVKKSSDQKLIVVDDVDSDKTGAFNRKAPDASTPATSYEFKEGEMRQISAA